ncbi:hypothetical protein H2198_003275 [Neophaeococcomyces mojaviensis]|uniref:Uncharacterized protein n=1 Tax=Neophaeococcomyces mojaviensis TaxID=3383035 RepID=A0ACC3AC64_9EURO|nr:hypothetical protein H2198_003275 [Knufia sp. JES_112]
MSTPTPYFLLGKIPGHLQACINVSKPDFEGTCFPNLVSRRLPVYKQPGHTLTPRIVVLHKSSVDDAIRVLPTLLSGGEVDGQTCAAIKLVTMGGGFSHADFQKVLEAVPGAKDVPWLRPEATRPGGPGPPVGGGPPSAEFVAGRLRRALDEHADQVKEGKGRGEVWWF